jgi:outer membrane protein assembly factor BamD
MGRCLLRLIEPTSGEVWFVGMNVTSMGMNDLRDDAERVMKKNFPDSVYLKGGPRKDVPWWQIWNY